jgi:hypothetical protein
MAASKSSKTKARVVEWVGGLASMPAYVTGEGDAYRPEMLIWMSADGLVLGCETGRPGELLPQAAALLRGTTARPLAGKPHVPQRIRVASDELAVALRDALPGASIVRGPTPEIDAMLASMHEAMAEGDGGATTYFTHGIDAPAVAGFFRASAAFHRAAPWATVPADAAIAVQIEALGVDHAAVAIAGQSGSAHGFLVFDDVASFQEFLDVADDLDEDELEEDVPVLMPPHLAVHFALPADLPQGLAAEVTQHGWEVAARNAVPWPVALDDDLVPRPVSATELRITEAVALAVAELVTSVPALEKAWFGGEPVSRTLTVATDRGSIEVTLTAPAESADTSAATVPPFGVVDDLRVLEGEATELDVEEANLSKFGTAKAVIALGLERGFDMESRDGIEAFMRSMEGQPLPASIRLPGAPAVRVGGRAGPSSGAAKKKARKAKKGARK